MKPKDSLMNLQTITDGCRDDMHEPDEQGLKARVVGTQLDNAFGEDVRGEALAGGYQELVVILERDPLSVLMRGGVPERYGALGEPTQVKINLASLIALARKAVL
ncbi:MAG: hypothetical protein HY646_13810 [Acidobacteria bacterium]|nr:hypothetical protein [Acidobacteriota bacterium]